MLTPISHKAALSQLRRAKTVATLGAKASVFEGPVASQELVEITGGTTTSALKGALKNAGGFFLRHGLSLAGLAVGGPIGLAVGSAASGAFSAWEHSGQGPQAMLKAGLKTTALSLGVGTAAGLPGFFFTSLAATLPLLTAGAGTALSFGLDFQERKKKPDFHVRADKLAKRYRQAVDAALQEAGKSSTLLGKCPNLKRLSSIANREAQISIAKTALVASKMLGPAAAIALAGQIGREGISSARLGARIQSKEFGEVVSKGSADGVEVVHVKGFRKSQATDGLALHDKIYLDADLVATGEPKADFVIGHEKSHVNHHDSSATLVQKAVLEAVAHTYDLSGNSGEKAALSELHSDLEKARFAESRDIELRADNEGKDYALRHGHTETEIYHAAKELFKNEPGGDDTYREHPQAATRLRALKAERQS